MSLRFIFSYCPRSTLILAIPSRSSHYRKHLRANPNAVLAEKKIKDNDSRLFENIAPAFKSQVVSANYDPVFTKFVGIMTKQGERDKAREILRKACEEIKHTQLRKRRQLPEEQREAIDVSPKAILNKAVANCTPVLELTPIVRAGMVYMVPKPVKESLAQHRAILFLLKAAEEKPSEVRLYSSLGKELLYASRNEGKAIRMKMELYKKCQENRAFANFRYS